MMEQQPSVRVQRSWGLPWQWRDAVKKSADSWTPSRAEERRYERQLSSVAEQVERIIRQGGSPEETEARLREYSKIIAPWAEQSAANMMAGVNRKNVQAWSSAANRAGIDMSEFLYSPGVGAAVRDRIRENVRLITSLPLGAAERINSLVRESMITGTRADDIAQKILDTGDITLSRARAIARTEVSKASTALTLARAESVGSEGYIWRTARDGNTRTSHRAMEGKLVAWNDPPNLDGMTGHAGEFPNCRCYPEPVIPRRDGSTRNFASPLPTFTQEMVTGEQKLLSVWEKSSPHHAIRHVPGAPLNNASRAKLDRDKLVSYSLNPNHPTGKDKARVWQAALGVTEKDADIILDQVMALLPHMEASYRGANDYGAKYNVTIPVTGPNGKTVDVTTGWMYDFKGKDVISTQPRLTTIFIAGKKPTNA